jgi:hypothetical protein
MAKRAPRPPKGTKRQSGQTPEQIAEVSRDAEVIAARRVDALTYRLAGASYRKIAKQLGVSVETAWSDVQSELRALRSIAVQDAEELRELEMQRLDQWALYLAPAAQTGDARAIATLVRIQERRAKLLGIDAPTRNEHTGKNGAPIAHAVTVRDLSKLSEAQLEAAADIARTLEAPEADA